MSDDNKDFHPKQIEMLREFLSNDELYEGFVSSNQWYSNDVFELDLREDITSWLNRGFYLNRDGFWSKETLNDLRDFYIDFKKLK